MDNNLLDQFDTPKFENDELPLWQKALFILIPLVGVIGYFAFSGRVQMPKNKLFNMQVLAL